MSLRFGSGSSPSAGPAAALLLALAACTAPASTEIVASPTDSPPPTSAPSPTATRSATATEAPTPTVPPSPTAPPADLTISPSTLAQLRPLWVLDEPGNPRFESSCQDMACWMQTRIGGYAFSPDGATLAVGICTVDSTENKTNPRHYRYKCPGPAEIRLYDSASGERMQTLSVGDFPISFAFHPGGQFLAAGMAQRSIEIWDLAAEKKVQTLLHSTTRDGVTGLAFSPDGALLVSDGDRLLQLWRWDRGLPAGMIEGASDFVFSPDGERLVTLKWSERGDYVEARFYPLDDLEAFRAFRLDWSKSPSWIRFIPDGSALVALGQFELEWVDPKSGDILLEAESEDVLHQSDMTGYPRLTPLMTGDGRLMVPLSVQTGDGSYLDGPALWDPRAQGAHAWLSSFEDLLFEKGETVFIGFDQATWTLAPGDVYLLGKDYYSGVLWIWGIDPTVPADGVTCLGTCSS